MTGNSFLLRLAGLLLLFVSHLCLADCTASSASGSFGSLSSFTLASTAETVETGSGFTCTGGLLTLLSTDTITATIASSAGESGSTPQMTSASGSAIPYTICASSGCGTTYTIGQTITWSSTSLLGLLGLFDASDGSLPLYIHTAAGLNVPAGTYTDTITINWHYNICFIGLLGICAYTTGDTTSTVTLTAIVTNDCTIEEAPDVSFGSAALPADFASVASALTVLCTKNAAYTVNLSSSNPVSGDWRQMSSAIDGSTRYLLYQLYQADGTAWTPENDLSETGTGESQTINYTATVDSSQTNQPAGSYTDTITVTVTY
ncbi:spore coat protein U domain-containing protein [Tatumella sp. JGM118]|uniref:Spore coat protein U domain-containing protein n=1 Tax=Tatumella terrea TaxID=419007 RepID=A0ABW1VX22_9GAMM|nr:spore coat protein U domain-containing protein [Tatumella sp. JGM118]MBS0909013.1 spore coat protein U domain-containing protein [Tatumella sp. JGM118]